MIFCFGEILLRMSPAANGAWIDQHALATYVGGAEANVATALANWKVPVKYCTALPDNYMGHDVERYLQLKNIDTSAIIKSGNRIGLYFMQQGADLKHNSVFYDRAYSSFSELKPGMINWDEALKDVTWFHFSAISPALNKDAVAVCKEALEFASAKGITISVDLNYRAKLWQYGMKPVEVMPELVQYCDVVMGNIWAANTLLGIELDESVAENHFKRAYLEHALETSKNIQAHFPKCKTVANTFRFDYGEKGIEYYTTFFHEGKFYQSIECNSSDIVDKAGSGDCFMGGLIYGFENKLDPQSLINFATAAAFGKLKETGDATNQTIADVLETLKKYEQETSIL